MVHQFKPVSVTLCIFIALFSRTQEKMAKLLRLGILNIVQYAASTSAWSANEGSTDNITLDVPCYLT